MSKLSGTVHSFGSVFHCSSNSDNFFGLIACIARYLGGQKYLFLKSEMLVKFLRERSASDL